MVATAYGTLAIQTLAAGGSGRMAALQGGRYTTVPVDSCVLGTKRVDVAELYDTEQYRPVIRHVPDTPMFLY
jgi:6-phosphofructokinase 1